MHKWQHTNDSLIYSYTNAWSLLSSTETGDNSTIRIRPASSSAGSTVRVGRSAASGLERGAEQRGLCGGVGVHPAAVLQRRFAQSKQGRRRRPSEQTLSCEQLLAAAAASSSEEPAARRWGKRIVSPAQRDDVVGLRGVRLGVFWLADAGGRVSRSDLQMKI
jgi:hypothetical protein